jgi:hypothetical protein
MEVSWKFILSFGLVILVVGVLFIPELGILSPYKTGGWDFTLPTREATGEVHQYIGDQIGDISYGDRIDVHGTASHPIDFYILIELDWTKLREGFQFSSELSRKSVTDFTVNYVQNIQGPTYKYCLVFYNSIDPSENNISWSWKYMPGYNLRLLVSVVLVLVGIGLISLGVYDKVRRTRTSVQT